jgi:hypothetical protein
MITGLSRAMTRLAPLRAFNSAPSTSSLINELFWRLKTSESWSIGVVLTRRTCPPVLLSPAEIVESAQPNSLYGVRLRLDRNHMTSITGVRPG